MPTTLDLVGAFAAQMKEFYSPDQVIRQIYTDRPLLARLPKFTDWVGSNYVVTTVYGSPQGFGTTVTDAQANKEASSHARFSLTSVDDYATVDIDRKTIKASVNDMGSFLRAKTEEVDLMVEGMANRMAVALYGTGTGSIGTVGSIATNTVTLANPTDIHAFSKGQYLKFAATETGAVRADNPQIVSVNRVGGAFTVDAIGATAVADHVFNRSDAPNGGANKKASGMQAWLVGPSVTATPFFGQDRSLDSLRLAGNFVDGTALDEEEAILRAATVSFTEGGKPTDAYMHPDRWRDISSRLEGSAARYNKVRAHDAEIFFDTLTIQGPRGPINLIPDPFCPINRTFVLDMSTWKLCSIGPAPEVQMDGGVDSDGLERLPSADGFEVRGSAYYQLGCKAPGRNVLITNA